VDSSVDVETSLAAGRRLIPYMCKQISDEHPDPSGAHQFSYSIKK